MNDISREELDEAAQEIADRNAYQRMVMDHARHWIELEFGERCPTLPSENCECCRRWRLFDELFAEGPL